MNEDVKYLLNVLISNGYEAYLVGGYVRDNLIQRYSYDIDIATNARPDEICTLFNTNNSNFGSVNIKYKDYNVDITTYRKDIEYVDRRPSKMCFVDTIKEDVKRRDFTINALYADVNGFITDFYGGIDDLIDKVIKIIGDANERIVEDPLRIMRAIRFATVLDFNIDNELLNVIKEKSYLVKNLSSNRIKEELEKILGSKNFLKGLELMDNTGINKHLGISYNNIKYVENIDGMWAQIKANDIPFTNEEKSNIIKITDLVSLGNISNVSLYRYGVDINITAGEILGISECEVREMYDSLPIKSIKDIDIKGKEIEEVLGDIKVIGECYKDIEDKILSGKLGNNNKEIREYLEKRK